MSLTQLPEDIIINCILSELNAYDLHVCKAVNRLLRKCGMIISNENIFPKSRISDIPWERGEYVKLIECVLYQINNLHLFARRWNIIIFTKRHISIGLGGLFSDDKTPCRELTGNFSQILNGCGLRDEIHQGWFLQWLNYSASNIFDILDIDLASNKEFRPPDIYIIALDMISKRLDYLMIVKHSRLIEEFLNYKPNINRFIQLYLDQPFVKHYIIDKNDSSLKARIISILCKFPLHLYRTNEESRLYSKFVYSHKPIFD